jgi:hypothetical protein
MSEVFITSSLKRNLKSDSLINYSSPVAAAAAPETKAEDNSPVKPEKGW